jgi:beta-catenin-like protein 1
LNESEEGAEVLIDELLKNQIIETLVQQCINRMNEENKDESDAIQNALSIVENVGFHKFVEICIIQYLYYYFFQILDFRPNSAQQCVEQGLFNWLLLRSSKKSSFDANKMYASQLLAQLLQSTTVACQKLTEKIDGIGF